MFQLTVDRDVYAPGIPVRFVITLVNSGTGEVTVELPTSQVYDVVVLRSDSVIWRWSADKAFLQALTRISLGPAQTRAYEVVWDQRDAQGVAVPPGLYAAQARLTTAQPLMTEPLPFRIGPAGGTGTTPLVFARRIEQPGGTVGEVVVNGIVVLRMREAAGALTPLRRAEIIAERLEGFIGRGLRPEELRTGTIRGEAVVLWRSNLLVTADTKHARLNWTTPLALSRFWREQLARALSP